MTLIISELTYQLKIPKCPRPVIGLSLIKFVFLAVLYLAYALTKGRWKGRFMDVSMDLYFYKTDYLVFIFLRHNEGHCGRDRMVVGFTTIYAISAYHH